MGILIQWYHPKRKAQPKPEPEPAQEHEDLLAEPALTAAEVIAEIQPHLGAVDEILVIMRSKDGQQGFVTNLDGLAESCLFIDTLKQNLIASRLTPPTAPGPGKGRA